MSPRLVLGPGRPKVITPPDPDAVLAAALTRTLATTTCPKYLRDAATLWLAHEKENA